MNNFTPRAQQVLALARKEADRFNHNFVGTEHLLLGLIKLGQGVAVNVLQKMGLDLETVRMEVEKQVGTGPDQKVIGNIPYTPRVKKVLALASKEAKALNHTYVGTEHILLGLLREGDGVAARVLKGTRSAPANKRAIAVAIIDSQIALKGASELGAHFVLFKPISLERTKASFRSVRALMKRERRRQTIIDLCELLLITYRNKTLAGCAEELL